LKKDLVKINGALDKVRQLTGFTYTRIDNGERQTGLLAQDVQKVLPEAVIENSDEMKTLSVAYGNLAGLLVESIKEVDDKLEAKIKKLEDVIASQQKIIDILYKHVQASLDDGK
jgi:DNA gyrase/topoisomerase IV subunit A